MCFRNCKPQYTPESDPHNVKFLGMLSQLAAIFYQFNENECEINDGTYDPDLFVMLSYHYYMTDVTSSIHGICYRIINYKIVN